MSSYPSTTLAVLAVRHASAGKGVDLTCVRSVVRSLGCRPYLCQVGRTTAGAPILASDQLPASGRPCRQASFPRAHRRGDQLLARGGFGLVPSGSSGTDQTEQEIRNLNCAGADPTEQELGNWNGAGVDSSEHELGNLDGAGADPTEHELGNLNDAGVDPTEHELGNLNGSRADPTEHELGNLNGAGADPTEHKFGNLNGAGTDPTEHELGNLNLGFCRGGELGHKS
ncbi:hypothetical protein BHE74_00040024 [Ensete ventricosum]|nr:hypothetical protein BHE74_00040024 [Ensete ventricosum]